MNRNQILVLMMRENRQNAETDLLSISALMAETLADVADRLSEDEFYRFISIGAAIYNHGVVQLEDGPDDTSIGSIEDSASERSMRRRPGFQGRH